MSRCRVINCNNKIPNNRGVSYFRLPPNTSVHKYYIHFTGSQVDDLPSKNLYIQKIFKKYLDPSWKLQNKQYCKDHQIGRRLLPRSVPTLLTHKKIKNFADLQRKEH